VKLVSDLVESIRFVNVKLDSTIRQNLSWRHRCFFTSTMDYVVHC